MGAQPVEAEVGPDPEAEAVSAEDPDLVLAPQDLAWLVMKLASRIYISTACVADQHSECRTIDKYRALPCLCPVCGHVSTGQGDPVECGPLLHYAEERQELGYRYRAAPGLGVRGDLYRVLRKELVVLEPPAERSWGLPEIRAGMDEVAYKQAVAVAMALAPRWR